MTRRKISLTLASGTAVLLAAATLTGCGQQVTGAADDAQSSLTYWSSWSEGEPQQKIFADLIADFEQASGIDVDVRWLGRDYVTTINNANAVGGGPDVFDNSTDNIAEFRSKGGVGDVEGVLDRAIPGEDRTVADVLPASALKASSDDDGLGMIPYSIISTAMWFDAASHPDWTDAPPQSFDDFLATAAEIRDGGSAPIAQDGTINFYNAYWFYWLQMRHGGPGTLAALGDSPEAWDAPSVRAAAADVERMTQARLFSNDFMGSKYPEAQNAWAAGDHTFIVNGSWLASETAPMSAEGREPRTFPFPSVADGFDSVEVGALGWTVNAATNKVDAAQDFLAFAMQKKYIERISTEALNISARSDVEAPEALTALQQQLLEADSVHKTYDEAPALHAGWWNDVFLPLSDRLLSGSLSATEFVAEGKRQTAAFLAAS